MNPSGLRHRFAVLIALLCLFCSPAPAQELNSERIERLFGSYGVDILHQSDRQRVSCLYSRDRGVETCRTFAVVSFADALPDSVLVVHEGIRAGASIGATLAENGWQIRKINRYLGSLSVPSDSTALTAGMRLEPPIELPMHVYRLVASRGAEAFDYATLIEVHHPDLHSLETLRAVYGDSPGEPASRAEEAAWKSMTLDALAR